jgi:protein-tyrosine phosphatase
LYSRQINFEGIGNFRDLGGYQAKDGRLLVWRKVFRSSEVHHLTGKDLARLKGELGLAAIVDLRSDIEILRQGLGLLPEAGLKYFKIALMPDGGDREANRRRYKAFNDMGPIYTHLIQQKEFGDGLVQALEVIAGAGNLPLVFHCSAGKDRTGVLAAILLSALEVSDQDIIADFASTGPYIENLFNEIKGDPRRVRAAIELPGYFWKASPESMARFLTFLRQEYGSAREYLKNRGADSSLFNRLEEALLDKSA